MLCRRCGLRGLKNRKLNIVWDGSGGKNVSRTLKNRILNVSTVLLLTVAYNELTQGNNVKKRLMSFTFEKTPCISLTCKLPVVPVHSREDEYGSHQECQAVS